MERMKQENLLQFLNKRVRILVDVGQPKPFRYLGTISSVDGEDVIFEDCRQGTMVLSCSTIIGCYQEVSQ